MELKRPKKKTETAPLTEADRCGFFPYIPEDYALPSQSNSWKTDEIAVALIEALNDPREEVSLAAGDSLAKIGDPLAIEALTNHCKYL